MSRYLKLMLLTVMVCGFVLGLPVVSQSAFPTSVDGYVVDGVSGQPIAGAQVRLSTDGTEITWETNSSGHFSGQVSISGEYQLATVTVQAGGYSTWVMRDTPLFAGQTRIFPAIMLRTEPQVIDAGGLPADEPPPPPEYLQRAERTQPQRGPQFWSHEVIPTSIRVARTGYLHCGYWENGSYILYPVTSVQTVDFREYVKNVLPNEWISSWHPESLKAGAVAGKMYAWWKINIGPRGEWNGQEYDVRGDTCDQVYIPNSQVSSTNDAVDATWGIVMRLNGLVSRIHYTDRVSTCQSAGLSPCMGQWDSKYMADAGADFQTILLTFYQGFQITFQSNAIPMAPAHVNLVNNGGFDSGFAFWSRALGTDYAVYNEGEGTFLAWKGRSGSAGIISQFLNVQMPAAAPVEVALELGNSSAVTKTVRVYVQRYTTAPDWSQAAMCQFSIPPNTPLRSYVMRFKTGVHWPNTRLQIEGYPVDNLPDVLTDSVIVRYLPTLTQTGTQCISPAVPGFNATFWDFTLPDAPAGWYAGSAALLNPTRLTAGFRFETGGSNPHLLGPTIIPTNAASNRYLYIKMTSNADSCGRVYFLKQGQRTFRETQAVNFSITPDGTLRRYVVDMSANANWTDTITRLRLDPACDAVPAGKLITLERMLLWDDPESPQPPTNIVRITPQAATTLTDSITPTSFQWQRDAEALWYHVYLTGPDGLLLDKWYTPEAVCVDSTCTLPITYLLRDGSHNWWMAGWGYDGYGPYSNTQFTVALARPGLINRVPPADALSSVFQWQPRSDTVWYHVYLAGPGGVVVNQWHKGADVCDETICTLPTAPPLVNGEYNWWMAGWNRAGTGAYDNVTFSITEPAPTTVTRISPTDGAVQPAGAVNLQWQAAPHATWYRVYVVIPGAPHYDRWVNGSLACTEGTCSHGVTLPVGSFNWWMQPWGPGGYGSWNMTAFSTQ